MLGYLVRLVFEAIRNHPDLQQRTQVERDKFQKYLDSASSRNLTENLDGFINDFGYRKPYKGRY